MPQIFGFSTSLNSCGPRVRQKSWNPTWVEGLPPDRLLEDGDGYFPKQAVPCSGLLYYSLASL